MKTILIADDDSDDIDIFREAVKVALPHVKLMSAVSSKLFFEMLDSSPENPDAVFLDLNMPKINGLEILVALKKDERLKTIPVVIYSTSTSEVDMSNTYKAGAVHFIIKPSSMEKLISLLRSIAVKLEQPVCESAFADFLLES